MHLSWQRRRYLIRSRQQLLITTLSLSILSLIIKRCENQKRTSCQLPATNESLKASTSTASRISNVQFVKTSSRDNQWFVNCPVTSSIYSTQSVSGPGSKSRMLVLYANKPFLSVWSSRCKASLMMKKVEG